MFFEGTKRSTAFLYPFSLAKRRTFAGSFPEAITLLLLKDSTATCFPAYFLELISVFDLMFMLITLSYILTTSI